MAGHHGSKNSTAGMLLDAFEPQAAVISVGETNNFGHPAPETLDRLFSRGVAVYRTDAAGNVVVKVR